MRLRSLEIQGFKSFPDKTKLTFGDGITAVVGPNGSGKSNIADAMRWVLGEQSTKNLRGQKMEDVIFGGTQTRKGQGFAAVQLTIDNADRALGWSEDEVVISRRLYRSGESEYRLGNTAVRLRDIHELLMDTGLGRDGYSIIGQGRIAEIVSAKSGQRREIFEEAAGIAKYRYRKEEAEKRLNQAEENLLRLRDILLELEGRVEPLRQQAEKAKSFLEMSGERRSLEISLWLMELRTLKEQITAQGDKVLLCKNQYEQLERESRQIEDKINTTYMQSQEMGAQVETRRAAVKELEEQLSTGKSQAAVLENDIRHNEISIRRLEQDRDSEAMGAEGLRAQLEGKRGALADSTAELLALTGRMEAAQQRMADLREQSGRVSAEISGLTVRLDSLSQAMSAANLERTASETLLSESAQRAEALTNSSAGYDRAVEELEHSLAECGTQQQEQKSRIESLGNSLRGYQLKRDSRGAKLSSLQKKQEELRGDAYQKLQRAKLLGDLEANMEGFAHSVKHVLGEAKKGALRGVLGPVSSLIRVPEQYALAIETALGGALQHIVVQDEDTAKRAIKMLQASKAGRATFLPLTSVKGRTADMRVAEGSVGFVGAASGLVEYDPEFAGIVGNLLGRVCIARDLDAGQQIAKAAGYSFRIVTLDGQVINAGGSYTGGSSGRGSGVLGRRAEIEKLTAQAKQLQDDADGMEPDRKSIAEELASLDASVSGIQAEQQTAQEELVRLGYAGDSLARELEGARANRDLAAKELESLHTRLEELRGSGDATGRMMEEMEIQSAELGEALERAKTRQDSLGEGVENASAALADQRLAQVTAEKDHQLLEQEIRRVEEQMQTAGTRGAQIAGEIDALALANDGIRAQIAELETQRTQLDEHREQLGADIAQLREQRTELEASTTGLRAQERETSSRREGVSRELVRLEERRNTLQTDYDSIIAKLWDDYELTRTQAKEEAVEIPDKTAADRRLGELRGKIRALGVVNVAAIEEYAEVSGRYEFLSAQVKDVESTKEQLMTLIFDITGEMRTLFTENFGRIAEQFSRIFVQLFGGGQASLTLTESEDVLEAGVDIHVQPPGKIIKNLSLLSGGEQSFVAIAIYFAILKVKPAAFCLLDEIEAALDDVNVVRFANYLRQMSGKTQFIAITHRRGTMEEADILYGVTMQEEGVSKLLELHVSEVETRLGIKES